MKGEGGRGKGETTGRLKSPEKTARHNCPAISNLKADIFIGDI